MGWWADGVSLSKYAYNVKNRSAGWKIPARRGENQVVPGRSGSVPLLYGPTEDGSVALDMWALGANADGTIPASGNLRSQCLANLDMLTQIFGRGGLVELVRAEDETSDYGKVNLVPNPNFEAVDWKDVVRENVIANPGGEYSSGLSSWRWNLVANPSVEAARRASVYRTNYALNPRFTAEGAPAVVRKNLCVNPSFQASLKTWSRDPNTTLARVQAVTASWPIQGGKWSARCISQAAGTFGMIGGPARVTAGTTYSFGVDYRNACGGTRTVSLIIQWRNAQGTFLSSSTFTASPADGAVGRLAGSAAAPAGAVTGTPRMRVTASGANEKMFYDAVLIEAAAAPGVYFDGSTAENDALRHRWTDERGLSVSEEYRVRPRGWVGANTVTIGLTSMEARSGTYSMKLFVPDTASSGVMARQEGLAGARVGALKQVSGSIDLRMHPDMATVRSVSLLLECWDADGTNLGACTTTQGGGTSMTAVQVDLHQSGWQTSTVDGVWTRAGTARVTMTIQRAAAFAAGEAVYADRLLVETAAAAGEWFDGARPSDDTFGYAWSGDRHWSASTQTGSEVYDWTALDGWQWQTKNGRLGTYSMSVFPNAVIASTDRPGVQQVVVEQARYGRKHTFSVYVNPTRTQNCKARLGVTVAGVTTWTEGTSTSCTAGSWTRLSVTATATTDYDAAGEPFAMLTCQVRADAQPQATDEIQLDQLMLEPVENVRTWFSGNSGDGFEWDGTENRSVSLSKRDRANGWGAWASCYPSLERLAGGNGTSYCIRATASEGGTLGLTAGNDAVTPNTSYTVGVDIRSSVTVTGNVAIVWRDVNGVVISSPSSTPALTANTWARGTLTATSPANAVTAAVVVLVYGAAAGQTLDVDNAVFGFGTTSTYADGNSGGGWEWVGVPLGSESRQTQAAPNLWKATNATFVRSSAWAGAGTYSALATATGTSAMVVYPWRNGEDEGRAWRPGKGTTIGWSVKMKASASFRVTPRFQPVAWTGGAFVATADPVVNGTPVDFVNNDVKTVSMYGIPCPVGGVSSMFRPELLIQGAGGGNLSAGNAIAVDQAILTIGQDVAWFDGDSANARWEGDQDLSPSTIIGPARRAYVQVTSAIDMSSMAGGTRAEFSVEARIPDVYWEDTIRTSVTYPLPRNSKILSLPAFAGMTAPIEDARFVLTGPFNDLRLTDMGSGAWLFIDAKVKAGENVVVDCDSWVVRRQGGPSLVPSMSHAGYRRLLPLTLEAGMPHPRLRVAAEHIGDGASIKVTACRKYLIG